jgi:hypothetical protein
MLFERRILKFSGQLAQLVRAFGSHPRGHWFESSIAQLKKAGEMADKYFMRITHRENKIIKYGSIKLEELKRSPKAN